MVIYVLYIHIHTIQTVPIIEVSLVRRIGGWCIVSQATPLNQWRLPASLRPDRERNVDSWCFDVVNRLSS
jgi:hypothetical protein